MPQASQLKPGISLSRPLISGNPHASESLHSLALYPVPPRPKKLTKPPPTTSSTRGLFSSNSTSLTGNQETMEPVPFEDSIAGGKNPDLSLNCFIPQSLRAESLHALLKTSCEKQGLEKPAELYLECHKALVEDMGRLPTTILQDNAFQKAQDIVSSMKEAVEKELHVFRALPSDANTSDHAEWLFVAIEISINGMERLLDVARGLICQSAVMKPLQPIPSTEDPLDRKVESAAFFKRMRSTFLSKSGSHHTVRESPVGDEKDVSDLRSSQETLLQTTPTSDTSNSSSVTLFSLCTTEDTPAFAAPSDTSTSPLDNIPTPQQSPTLIKSDIPRSLSVFHDPANPELEVELPRPEGAAAAIYVNKRNIITCISLTALLRIITSQQAVINHELTDLFWVCFRLFSSPTEILHGLLNRYWEEPPQAVTDAQRRVWEVEAKTTRFRVAKVLLTWLTSHWRQETDAVIRKELIQFIHEVLTNDLPCGLFSQIAAAFAKCWSGRHHAQRSRKKSMAPPGLEQPPPIKFSHPLWGEMTENQFHNIEILDFNTEQGRKELGRQLTLRASYKYRKVDPQDAVLFWRGIKNQEVEISLTNFTSSENSIIYWVIDTILTRPKSDNRAEVIGFWLKVATVCVQLRNFSSASSIWAAINSGSVLRLRHTMQLVHGRYESIFRDIEDLFSFAVNHGRYREALRSAKKPAVPVLYLFKHDVVVTTELGSFTEPDLEDGTPLIDLTNCRIYTKTVHSMEACHSRYNLCFVEYIQNWIEHSTKHWATSDDSTNQKFMGRFDETSKRLEPRQTVTPTP